MSAAKVKHALGCPAYRTLDLTACTCGAPGSTQAQANVATAREAAAVHADVIDRREEQRLANVRRREERARAAEQLARDQAAAERIDARRGQPNRITVTGPDRTVDDERRRAHDLTQQLVRLLGRPLQIMLGETTSILQRCAACAADIRAVVSARDFIAATPGKEPLDIQVAQFSAIGAAARKAYLQHRCAPVETALLGFTYAELEALHVELERDGTEMIKRAAEIERMLRAQSGGGGT